MIQWKHTFSVRRGHTLCCGNVPCWQTHTHTQRLQLFYCSVCETLQGRCGTRTVNQYGGQNETWVTLTPTQTFIKPRTEIQQTLLSFPLSHNCGGKPAPLLSYLQKLGNLKFFFFCKTLEESQSRHSVLLRDQEQREAASSQQEPPIRDRLSTTMWRLC